eukprot:SAG11_NODE_13259_length_662_cov_2.531083_1_plen_55_part_10
MPLQWATCCAKRYAISGALHRLRTIPPPCIYWTALAATGFAVTVGGELVGAPRLV